MPCSQVHNHYGLINNYFSILLRNYAKTDFHTPNVVIKITLCYLNRKSSPERENENRNCAAKKVGMVMPTGQPLRLVLLPLALFLLLTTPLPIGANRSLHNRSVTGLGRNTLVVGITMRVDSSLTVTARETIMDAEVLKQ